MNKRHIVILDEFATKPTHKTYNTIDYLKSKKKVGKNREEIMETVKNVY